jgi:biopolymer transport protein ExbB
MQEIAGAWNALKFGGFMVYPLLGLGALALIIIVDRAVVYAVLLRLPRNLVELIENFELSWSELEQHLQSLPARNAYRRFLSLISSNRARPTWWLESRAEHEAGSIEKTLGRGLWVLETVVTAAPLLGLLGTITGMMQAFKVIGASSLVAPTQVTAGVAQALIATALGLLIAVFALFAFNFFARMQSQALDHMERLGSRLVDHVRMDNESETENATPIAAVAREGRAR